MLLYVCVTNPSSSWTFPSKYDAQASWPSSIPCSVSSLTITATFNEPSMMLMMVDSSRFRFLKFFFPGLFKLYKVRSLPSSGQTLAPAEPEARLYNHQTHQTSFYRFLVWYIKLIWRCCWKSTNWWDTHYMMWKSRFLNWLKSTYQSHVRYCVS